MRWKIIAASWLLLAGLVYAANLDYENTPRLIEICRIKLINAVNGSIEVSTDKGKTWEQAGKVLYPTTKISTNGFAAAKWAETGRVAATAVNAIHIKVGAYSLDRSVFSILPKEFVKAPSRYKSFLSPDSSIYTDIPAGTSIFGGSCSPFVGNEIKYLTAGTPLLSLPKNYVPALNDVLYIIVKRPADYPKEIVFENRIGGRITLKYFIGQESIIGEVLRPVTGIGRFEGGIFCSSGRVRANHPGVIDVTVSPLGEVGGFQIVPAEHGVNMEYVKSGAQWMVINSSISLEGRAPFFRYFIRPVYDDTSVEAENWDENALKRFLVEVKYQGMEKWHPMPIFEINKFYLNRKLPQRYNSALKNVSHIRILFPID